MSHSYALTMTRPHERFGITQPVGKQVIQNARYGWYILLWVAIFASAFTYAGFMITASTKGFQLRDAEQRMERLHTESRALETQVASLSSVQQLSERAHALGFVSVDRIETVNAAGHSYALAR